MGFTTDDLLASVKLRTFLPESQITAQDSDIIRIANEELLAWLIPLVIKRNKSLLLTHQDIDLATLTGTERKVRIPDRALFNKLYDVKWVDSAGVEQPLAWFKESELHGDAGPTLGKGFTLAGAWLILTPNAPTTGTLRLYYIRRPNELVLTSDAQNCQQITALDSVAKTVQVNALLGYAGADGLSVDLVNGLPPGDVRASQVESSHSGAGPYTYTLDAVPGDLAIGDWLCAPGKSPIPNLPDGLHPLLYQRVVAKVLSSLGDFQGCGEAMNELKEMQDDVLDQITPRVSEGERVIANTELEWGY